MNDGDIYLWEPDTDRGYSIGWNLQTIIEKGIPDHKPPKTSDELLTQMNQLAKESTTEYGQITFNSLDNYLVPFLAEEKPSKLHFIQQIESFFEEIGQTGNVTITLDLVPRNELKIVEKHQVILDAINDVIHQAYRAQMNHGHFQPSIIVNLYPETDWSQKSLNDWLELSYLYGVPTYQNFITGTISPETLRPRTYPPEKQVTYLRLGGVNSDSEDQYVIGYACINLEKIGSDADSEDHFFRLVDQQMQEAANLLAYKHNQFVESLEKGEKPLTKHLVEKPDWGYSVITLVGMNEALETLIDAPMGHVAGKAVTYKLLEQLIRKLEYIQEETGILFSLEAYPSEQPGAQLQTEYDSIYPNLTPATELPSHHGDDLWDTLEHQKKYHSMYTGATLQQMHLEHGLRYNKGLRLLIKRTIENFGYNYLAITPVFSLCNEHGYVYGDQDCPHCGAETETYTRRDHKIIKVSDLLNKEAYWRRVYYDVKNK
jgi:ribonucleoside-triphosphate reductase